LEIKVTLICGEPEDSGFVPYDPQFDIDAVYAANAKNLKRFGEITDECIRDKLESVEVVAHRAAILAILRRYCVPSVAYSNIELEHGGKIEFMYNSDTQSTTFFK